MIRCVRAMILVGVLSVSATAGTPPSRAGLAPASGEVLKRAPGEHTFYAHVVLGELDKTPVASHALKSLLTGLKQSLKEPRFDPILEGLGLVGNDLRAIHVTADVRPSRRDLGDVAGVFELGSAIDLEARVKGLRKSKPATALQTEMINGAIVFVTEKSGFSLMQLAPTMVMVSTRQTIKRVTKLKQSSSMYANAVLARWITANGSSYGFACAAVAPAEAGSFESLRIVFPSASTGPGAEVRAIVRFKSKGMAVAAEEALGKALVSTFQGVSIEARADTLTVTASATVAGIDHILQCIGMAQVKLPVGTKATPQPEVRDGD